MVTAAMGEDDRILKCLVVRELIVHVRLIDLVRIAFKRGYAGTSGCYFAGVVVPSGPSQRSRKSCPGP
jgi:hypothetical protein